MPRLVKHTATGPTEVKTKQGDSVWICRCGLTENEDGTCSGNHRKLKVADEEKDRLYEYDAKGERYEVTGVCRPGEACDEHSAKKDKECEGCCGGGCCKD